MKYFLWPLLLLLVLTGCTTDSELELRSPDQKNLFLLEVDDELVYEVDHRSDNIIERSVIGYAFKNAPFLGKDMEVVSVQKKEVDSNWNPVLKRYTQIRNHYSEMVVQLKERNFPGRRMKVEVRAYNDGIAFRSWFQVRDTAFQYTITDEKVGFNFKD